MSELDSSQCIFPIEDIWKLERPVAIFLDFMNLKLRLEENGFKFDIQSIVRFINEKICNIDLFVVYLPYNQVNGKFIQFLSNLGLIVRSESCKDVDAIMGYDISSSVHRLRIKTLIIGSHDGDFSPIVDEVKMLGCRVICFCDPSSLSSLLKEKVKVIDITSILSTTIKQVICRINGE